METLLREPLMALEASCGLLVVSPQLDRAAFERAVAAYLRTDSPLLALGIAQRVDRALASLRGGRAWRRPDRVRGARPPAPRRTASAGR
ncbi:hypothetical protein [Paucibacter sp. XJ19-41]|uniref:hypothetical protein n=1 Tax=Paucibacter sp. XJ19-41 TaxID=2927824 RepID=UPI00234B6B71|nr:hypothetical protein [Paucibacter sp. XJ19-41]MDC6167163.1 hypothetical protein [Paucibacter sp. XJ19-41]